MSCTQGGTEAQGAIRSGTRYAKWAGSSRSQTHRRAAMGGFTQDDGDVQGVAADALRLFRSSSGLPATSASSRLRAMRPKDIPVSVLC